MMTANMMIITTMLRVTFMLISVVILMVIMLIIIVAAAQIMVMVVITPKIITRRIMVLMHYGNCASRNDKTMTKILKKMTTIINRGSHGRQYFDHNCTNENYYAIFFIVNAKNIIIITASFYVLILSAVSFSSSYLSSSCY